MRIRRERWIALTTGSATWGWDPDPATTGSGSAPSVSIDGYIGANPNNGCSSAPWDGDCGTARNSSGSAVSAAGGGVTGHPKSNNCGGTVTEELVKPYSYKVRRMSSGCVGCGDHPDSGLDPSCAPDNGSHRAHSGKDSGDLRLGECPGDPGCDSPRTCPMGFHWAHSGKL